MLFILKVGCVSGTLFLDIKREVVKVGLKYTSQLSAQWCIVPKSELRVSATVLGFSTIIKRLVSSAKRRMFDWMLLTISLIKIRKIVVPDLSLVGLQHGMRSSLISFHL